MHLLPPVLIGDDNSISVRAHITRSPGTDRFYPIRGTRHIHSNRHISQIAE